jgi:ribonuclease-3
VKTWLTSIEVGANLIIEWASNKKLMQVAIERSLAEYIVRDPGQQGHILQTPLASTIEAIVGAVWVDSGKNLRNVTHVIKTLERPGNNSTFK